jgi:hypothetical protein
MKPINISPEEAAEVATRRADARTKIATLIVGKVYTINGKPFMFEGNNRASMKSVNASYGSLNLLRPNSEYVNFWDVEKIQDSTMTEDEFNVAYRASQNPIAEWCNEHTCE